MFVGCRSYLTLVRNHRVIVAEKLRKDPNSDCGETLALEGTEAPFPEATEP